MIVGGGTAGDVNREAKQGSTQDPAFYRCRSCSSFMRMAGSFLRGIRFVALALFGPIQFVLFLLVAGDGSLGARSFTVFGRPAFRAMGDNTYAIDLLFFIPAVLLGQGLALALHFLLLRVPRPKLHVAEFLSVRLGWFGLLPCSVGALNLAIWAGPGMEGNIAGFFFAPLMLFAAVVQVVIWLVQTIRLILRPQERNGAAEVN